jgi:hypothetical protein
MENLSRLQVLADFVDGRCGLSQFVRTLVDTDVLLDDEFENCKSLDSALDGQVCTIVERAPRDPCAAYEMHSVLNSLYSMRIAARGSVQEFSVRLFAIRRRLETAWLHSELEKCSSYDLPVVPTDFRDWFYAQAHHHAAAKHPLYEYIANEASLAAFGTFLSNESTVDARFDDLLAMVQLGFTGQPKMEVARNYWDELGCGRPARVHTTMFNRILDFVGSPRQVDKDLDVTALACGNLLLAFANYRSYAHYAIGALGITEALAPPRFERVLEAGVRLGIAPGVMEYFKEHVTVDEHHTRQWISNVIEPTLLTIPTALNQICAGVIMRLNTSLAYCNSLLSHLKHGDCQDSPSRGYARSAV